MFSFIFFSVWVFDTVLVCDLAWPGTCYIDQPSLELTEICLNLPSQYSGS